jgi:hypothetical protein
MCCGHAVESCGSEWFQSALTATISTTSASLQRANGWRFREAQVIQHFRDAFLYHSAPRYLIFDRGTNSNEEVIDTVSQVHFEPG